MKRIAIAMTVAALVVLSSFAGKMRVEDRLLTTGANSNAAATFYVDEGILDSFGIDIQSTLATGTVTLAIVPNTSTETTETLFSISDNAADVPYLRPCRWYSTSAGALHGVTNAPTPVYLYHATITANVAAVSTVATNKIWRIILRYIEP